MACFDCDQMLTRTAALALYLRKLAVADHARRHHSGRWETCPEEPCRDHARVLREAGIIRDEGHR